MHSTPDGNFLVAADSYDYDSPFNIRAALIKLDTMGRCLSFHEIDKGICTAIKGPLSNYIRDLKPDGHGGWLLLSNPRCYWSAPYTHIKYLLTKLDGNLNVVWEKEYGASNRNHIATKILVEPDGYVLAGGENNSNLVALNFIFRAELIKTDTAGNVQWTWQSDPTKKICSAVDVIRSPDGGYVYSGWGDGFESPSANGSSGLMFWQAWIEKLDAARNPVWSRTLSSVNWGWGTNELTVLRNLPNGDLAVAGGQIHRPSTADSFTQGYGQLARLAPDGTIRWQRKYRYAADSFEHSVHDMKLTPDGGFVLVGQSTDYKYPYASPTQRGWIIKVDSNGCLGPNDPQCWPTAIPLTLSPTKEALVFPNPATSALTVRCASTTGGVATLHLTDPAGREILHAALRDGETALDISRLHPGIYLWRISEDGVVRGHGKLVKQ